MVAPNSVPAHSQTRNIQCPRRSVAAVPNEMSDAQIRGDVTKALTLCFDSAGLHMLGKLVSAHNRSQSFGREGRIWFSRCNSAPDRFIKSGHMENFDDVTVQTSVQFHSLLASPTKSIGVFLPFYRYSCRRRFSVKEAVNEILVALNRSTRMQLQLHTQLLCADPIYRRKSREYEGQKSARIVYIGHVPRAKLVHESHG